MSKVFIFGTGKGAETFFRYFSDDSDVDVVGFVLDPQYMTTSRFQDLPVVSSSDVASAFPPGDVQAFVPLGFQRMNGLRAEKFNNFKAAGYRFASYVHSSNRVSEGVLIGENCIVLEHQCINYGAVIEDNAVVWSGCQIGDRARISNHVWLSAHVVLNGDVIVGERSFLGSNCTISHRVKLAERTFVGANALISRDTAEGAVHIVPSTPPLGMDSLKFCATIRA